MKAQTSTLSSTEALAQLKALGNPGTAKVLSKHGAKEPCYGVKIEDMKTLLKPIKGNNVLAKELFNSGVFDAMYFAGLVADGSTMTKKEIDAWAQKNYGSSISEYTVPWVAAESPFGNELALEWIESNKEFVAVSGWATLSSLVASKPDSELDTKHLKKLLARVGKEIHTAPNRVRYSMNNFVISVGSYVVSLTDEALKVGATTKNVEVNMGDTACKVPAATDYINKIKARGTLGKKKKQIKC